MIEIIIVEDEEAAQQKTKEVIKKVFFKTNLDFNIKVFKKYCKELKDIIKDNAEQKIFLLDIELNSSLSGINIANAIRENDWESEIIFLTNHDNMFEQVYRSIYKVFDFIEKYHNFEDRLTKDLNKIVGKSYDNKMFKFSNKKVTIQLYFKDITYITRDTSERKIIINTTNNRFLIPISIKECLAKVDSRFCLAHRACILNKNRVSKYNWHDKFFVLDTGEKVYLLSKKYKKEVLNDINN